MGFESLSHTPEFDLPANAPSPTADLISLIEECHEGLAKCLISKMVRRGKYEPVAVVHCQDNPTKKTRPSAAPDDIADYCMMCMQYEMDKSDDPGNYKVTLVGPPGKGRFERSKHIDLSDGDGMARSKTMQTEGELSEQQSQYIGELHSQIVAMTETMHGMIKPLLAENKEQMKIISESARRLAEVERDRMRFDLEMRMHQDQIKAEEAKEEMKNQRWAETMEVIKESGAVEGLMKALTKKLSQSGNKAEAPKPKKKTAPPRAKAENDEEKPRKKKKKRKKKTGESRVEKAKKKKRGTKKKKKTKSPISEETAQAIENNEELDEEQLQEVFEASGMEKARENPLSMMVEILKMSIDENEQWEIVEETLTEEQFTLFKRILNTEDDDEKVERLLKKLYDTNGIIKRATKLDDHLTEQQQGIVEKLLEVAMSD